MYKITYEVRMSNKQIEHVVWPRITNNFDLQSTLKEIDSTQWLKAKDIETLKSKQLYSLLRYAHKNSPYFANKLKTAGLTINDICKPDGLKKVPILTRRELQENIDQIVFPQIPETHLPYGHTSTSGSSGIPLKSFKTSINQLFFLAYRMRHHIWQKRRCTESLATIKSGMGIHEPKVIDNWGQPLSLIYKTTGKAHAIPIKLDIEKQLDYLIEAQPTYIISYPSNFFALMQEMEKRNTRIDSLEEFISMGETLHPHIREKAENIFKIKVSDMYSSEELGIMALQCSETKNYHVMETVIIEIVNSDGEYCKPGEVGKVLVTDLINYATPFIRYEIGDYAEVGEPCKCGRGLQTIKRIVGSERHMMIVNGKKSWPMTAFARFRETAPIIQYQMIQESNDSLELRLVTKRPLTSEEENNLKELINRSIGHDFEINFTYYKDIIPPKESGKFEEFICKIKG